ncbi:F-box domain containing protein [Tanacetum coccineum]
MTVDWEVEVFALSTRVWKTVSSIPLAFKYCYLTCEGHVSIGGFIYWHGCDFFKLGDGIPFNTIVSFDLKSDEFGEVCLPDRLVHSCLRVLKVKESLGLLEYYEDGEVPFCGVWIMNEGVTKSFTKMFNVNILNFWRYRVLEFRNNGEAIIETALDDSHSSALEVCEPCSGRHNGIGIDGKYGSYSVKSYMETLLLLDQSNSIIH